MRPPLISVITPVYNAALHIEKMVNSILMQSYSYWELILINDGSTDTTSEILKLLQKKDFRILILQQENAGPSVARNNGIKKAEGEYITFVDADDWVNQDYLEKLVTAMMRTSTDLVCAGYYEVNSQFPQGLKLHDFKKEQFHRNISKKTYQSNLFNGVSGVLWAKLFKREIFRDFNIQLHPQLRLSEDLIAVLKYSSHIENAYILSDAIYYYNRLDESGLSSRLSIDNYKELQILIKEIKKFRNELFFLDLNAIINKRKYTFMIQLLKVYSVSRKTFYKAAQFLVENEAPLDVKIYQNKTINDQILKWVFQKKYFKSWLLIKSYLSLQTIKNRLKL